MEKSTVSTKSVSKRRLLSLCEGAICIAMAYALSFLEIPIGVNGGSLSPAMIPILIFAIRNGAGMGIAAGFLFGIIKFFLAGGTALNWQSMLLDYSAKIAFHPTEFIILQITVRQPGMSLHRKFINLAISTANLIPNVILFPARQKISTAR